MSTPTIINPNEQPEKPVNFQDVPVTPQSAQQCLALLDQYERLQTEGPKLATPGNPNPEQTINELGGVIAGFLFNNARALLQNHQIAQMEYVPLLRGLHAALARGPFAHQIASAVVAGFAQMSADNAKAAKAPEADGAQQEKKS